METPTYNDFGLSAQPKDFKFSKNTPSSAAVGNARRALFCTMFVNRMFFVLCEKTTLFKIIIRPARNARVETPGTRILAYFRDKIRGCRVRKDISASFFLPPNRVILEGLLPSCRVLQQSRLFSERKGLLRCERTRLRRNRF